jgi:hypothetical protein
MDDTTDLLIIGAGPYPGSAKRRNEEGRAGSMETQDQEEIEH